MHFNLLIAIIFGERFKGLSAASFRLLTLWLANYQKRATEAL